LLIDILLLTVTFARRLLLFLKKKI
jgi:hypothetical protein